MMLPDTFRCGPCGGAFDLVEGIEGFATIPARRERVKCQRCGAVLDLYVWWPEIRGRRQAAILIDSGVPA